MQGCTRTSLTVECEGLRSELDEYLDVCDANKRDIAAWRAKAERLEAAMADMAAASGGAGAAVSRVAGAAAT